MKKKVAIVAGGYSSEKEVSLRSASSIRSFIDAEKYETYLVVVSQEKWEIHLSEAEIYPIDKNDFSFLQNDEKITFDFVYITIHGTPGENGLLQGYLSMLGIAHSTCDTLTSAITFDKFWCNNYLRGFGVKVGDSLLIKEMNDVSNEAIVEKIGLPCFVKPNTGGSSFGTTKVKTVEMIHPAIEIAHKEGGNVIVESFLQGNEFTCGMYKTKNKTVVFPVTEIVTNNEFFDYGAKYNHESEEITPARISSELTSRIQQLTVAIYDILGCKGIVRADYVISKYEDIALLEVNTVPGMTETSFIPQQIRAAGLDIKNVMTDIIEGSL